jgi:hypothetical protein
LRFVKRGAFSTLAAGFFAGRAGFVFAFGLAPKRPDATGRVLAGKDLSGFLPFFRFPTLPAT